MKTALLVLSVLVLSGCAVGGNAIAVSGTGKLYLDHTSACFAPCVLNPDYDPRNFESHEAPVGLPCLGWANGVEIAWDREALLKQGKPIYPAILYVNEQGDWDSMWVRGKP